MSQQFRFNGTTNVNPQGIISPQFTYISYLNPGLSISSSGLSTCVGAAAGYFDSYSTVVTAELQMPNKTVNYHGREFKSKVISIKNQNENVYEIPKSQIDNGELAFYKINGRDGINLEKGDEVLIVLNIKTENVDHCVLGYCLNEEYIDFFPPQYLILWKLVLLHKKEVNIIYTV